MYKPYVNLTDSLYHIDGRGLGFSNPQANYFLSYILREEIALKMPLELA